MTILIRPFTRFFFTVALGLCLALNCSTSLNAEEPAELGLARMDYEAKLAVPKAKLEAAILARGKRYVGDLKLIEDKVAAAGQLDGVILVKAEREAYEQGRRTPGFATGDAKVPQAARQLRTAFDGDVIRLQNAAAPETAVLAQNYTRQLGEMERRLTSQKNIESALAVRRERDAMQQGGLAPLAAGATQPSALHTQLLNTTWKWWKDETTTFLAAGKVRWSHDSKATFTWKVADPVQRIVEGITSQGKKYTITFDASFTTGSLVDGNDGNTRQIQLLKK